MPTNLRPPTLVRSIARGGQEDVVLPPDLDEPTPPGAVASRDLPYLWLPILVAIALLLFLVGPLGREVREPLDLARGVSYAGVAAFVVIYLWAIPRDLAGRHDALLLPAVVALAVLAVAISLLDSRASWTVLFLATATGAGRLTPSRVGLVAIAVTTALSAVAPLAHGAESMRTLESALEIILVGLVVVGFSQYERTLQDLRSAQAAVASAATDLERARISRDLHDLLGHSLSMVALKTELARRLIVRDPDRAATELADVEDVVRTSLRDVRQAVAGYRQVSLETELAGARVALDAAGFEVLIERPDDPLAPDVDSLLGWVVREGVTNVIRHSSGSQCSIAIEQAGDQVRLEILDDGPGPRVGSLARASVGTGRGIRGIGERVHQAGGTIESGWLRTGGYRLAASVPSGSTAGRGQGGTS